MFNKRRKETEKLVVVFLLLKIHRECLSNLLVWMAQSVFWTFCHFRWTTREDFQILVSAENRMCVLYSERASPHPYLIRQPPGDLIETPETNPKGVFSFGWKPKHQRGWSPSPLCEFRWVHLWFKVPGPKARSDLLVIWAMWKVRGPPPHPVLGFPDFLLPWSSMGCCSSLSSTSQAF